jgi:hypothetical protein
LFSVGLGVREVEAQRRDASLRERRADLDHERMVDVHHLAVREHEQRARAVRAQQQRRARLPTHRDRQRLRRRLLRPRRRRREHAPDQQPDPEPHRGPQFSGGRSSQFSSARETHPPGRG